MISTLYVATSAPLPNAGACRRAPPAPMGAVLRPALADSLAQAGPQVNRNRDANRARHSPMALAPAQPTCRRDAFAVRCRPTHPPPRMNITRRRMTELPPTQLPLGQLPQGQLPQGQIPLRHGVFLPPFHPMDENPTACLDRDLELMEWLDRLGYQEAWIGEHHSAGWEMISLARAVHRRGRRAHQAHPPRHRRGLAALPQPADGGGPHHPARPPDRGPGDVRRRTGPAGVGRDDAGHRSRDPARQDGPGARSSSCVSSAARPSPRRPTGTI